MDVQLSLSYGKTTNFTGHKLLHYATVTVYNYIYSVYVTEIIISKGGLIHTYVPQM